MLVKIIFWFVFNFVYWLVNPLSFLNHCRNAGFGAQQGLLSFYKNKTYHINSGHILNALGILFIVRSLSSSVKRVEWKSGGTIGNAWSRSLEYGGG